MQCIYIFIPSCDWEDFVVLLTEEEAIRESIRYPNARVEVFSKNENGGYYPTYDYYKNGKKCS
jgi:hypothetical protein